MTVVFDASALNAALVNPGPEGQWAQSFLDDEDLAGPEFVLAEATNYLRNMETLRLLAGKVVELGFTRNISGDDANYARLWLLRLPITLHRFAPYAERIWALRSNVTCYDAWYVAVAESLGCPLVTLDMRLSRANGPTCEIVVPPQT